MGPFGSKRHELPKGENSSFIPLLSPSPAPALQRKLPGAFCSGNYECVSGWCGGNVVLQCKARHLSERSGPWLLKSQTRSLCEVFAPVLLAPSVRCKPAGEASRPGQARDSTCSTSGSLPAGPAASGHKLHQRIPVRLRLLRRRQVRRPPGSASATASEGLAPALRLF